MKFSTKSNIHLVLSLISLVLTNTWALVSNSEEGGQDISFLCKGSGNRPSCEVLLDVPESCIDEHGISDCPIVFFLHGSGGSIRSFAKTSGIRQYGFIGVYPQGEAGWNTGPKNNNVCEWDDFDCIEDPNEGLFIKNIIEHLHRVGAVGNVYAIGNSNGAALALRLAANADDNNLPIKGIVTFVTQLLETPEQSGPGTLNYNQPKKSSRKVSVLSVMGTEDWVIPYEGGTSAIFGGVDDFALMSALESMEVWATHNNCTTTPNISTHSSDQGTQVATKYVYPNCTDGTVVEHYAIEGGGHNAGGASIDGVKVSYDLAHAFIRNVEENVEENVDFVAKAACIVHPNWHGKFDAAHTCEFVGENPSVRCAFEDANGVTADEACPCYCEADHGDKDSVDSEEEDSEEEEDTEEEDNEGEDACEDDTDWHGKYSADHTCAFVSHNPSGRCAWVSAEGTPASAACPLACDSSCDTWVYVTKEGDEKGCAWVSNRPKKRCNKEGTDGRKAQEACPKSCSKQTSEIIVRRALRRGN